MCGNPANVNNHNDRVYTKSSADIDDSVRTVYRQQNPFSLIVWAAVSKSRKSPLFFLESGVKINSYLYTNNSPVSAFEEMKKHFKDHILPSNKMEHHPTPKEKLRTDVNVIFQDSGVRRCGLLHYLIRISWIFWCGLY